jgi:hypothetical protein
MFVGMIDKLTDRSNCAGHARPEIKTRLLERDEDGVPTGSILIIHRTLSKLKVRKNDVFTIA